MSANPFAALGEDGPNPVAAKGAKFLFFPSLSSKLLTASSKFSPCFLLLFNEVSERVRVQFANAIDTARALREIYFILIPIETNVNMFCTFELIGFRGIHTFKRRYISSRLRPVSRANPLSLMKELNSLFSLFWVVGEKHSSLRGLFVLN